MSFNGGLVPPPPEGWRLNLWRYQEGLRGPWNARGEINSDGFLLSRDIVIADWLMDRTQERWEVAYGRARDRLHAHVGHDNSGVRSAGRWVLVALAQQEAARRFFSTTGVALPGKDVTI